MGTIEDMAKKFLDKARTTAKAATEKRAIDVDVELAGIAEKKGGGGNYKTSIVDLLKLLDMDSSLDARKKLAVELGVNAGAHGSAEQNIALHRAVMERFAKDFGKVASGDKTPTGGRQVS